MFIRQCSFNQSEFAILTGQPRQNDVVYGRGKGSYNRPGNRNFQQICMKYVPAYQSASTKAEKSELFARIIHEVHDSDGRFLKFNTKERAWYEISAEMAREKVGHAMRQAVLSISRRSSSTSILNSDEFIAKHEELLATQRAIFQELLRIQNQT